MNSKRAWTLLLLVLMAASLWAGASAEGGSESTTITWWSPVWNEPRGDDLATAFTEANPGITVDVQKTVGQGLQDKILVALQSGAAPDIIDTQIPWVVPYSFTGFIQELNDYVDASDTVDPADFFEGVWGGMVDDGSIYGIPHRTEAHGFIYNKDMYRAAGLDPDVPPANWDEMLANAIALTDTSGSTPQYGIGIVGGGEIGNLVYNMMPWIWSNGGGVLTEDYSRVIVNEPAAVEAVKFYTDMLVVHHVAPPSTLQNGGNQNRDLFAEGVVAQFQSGSYVIKPILAVDPDMDFGFGMIPAPEGKSPAAVLGGWAYVIPSSAKEKDAAWSFIEFLAEPDNMAHYTDTFPPTRTAMQNPKFSAPEFEMFIDMLPYARATPPIPGWPQMTAILQREVQAILLGQKTAQDAMDDAAAAMSSLL
jgi:multiple sugar transport system substrate-binding protein